ncbi:MAG: SPOR domain-containing protein [Myxococcales bacterium]|nr:MAG: SPOR domain-containing protein [Myxococcales bacterium]
MDSEFRDLNHIQEQEDDTAMRRLSLIAMGAFAVVAVIFATGVVVVKGVDRKPDPGYDPLAELLAHGKLAGTSKESQDSSDRDSKNEHIDPQSLVFPETLRDSSSHAEVEAALAAAAAEAEHPDPIDPTTLNDQVPVQQPSAINADVASGKVLGEANHPVAAPSPAVRRTEKPTDNIAKIKVSAPVKKQKTGKGPYALQIISYTESAQAHEYADLLKQRGHDNVVVLNSTLPGKGSYWRVRVGPFSSREEAESYQKSFEAKEELKTLVVKSID